MLAELAAILDSFLTLLHRGGWSGVVGGHEVAEKHTLCNYTCIMDPLVLDMAHKVVKQVENVLQLGSRCSTASRDD